MKNRLLQAYKQAPWRVQMQWIGLFLLALVLISSLAWVYLSISAKAATAGRNIQSLEIEIDEINDEISKLTTDLAEARAAEKMMARAKEMGFTLLDPKTAVYVEIPGYMPSDEVVLAPPRVNMIDEMPIVQPAYKSSLWDWFAENIWQISADESSEGVLP